MAHKPNFTAQLTNKEAVIKVAASIGCIQSRGSTKGQGSIREMLEEIGGGDILVLHHVYDDGDKMRAEAKRIRKIAKEYIDEDLSDTLNGLANALELQSDAYDD